jgi:hypothetical protein
MNQPIGMFHCPWCGEMVLAGMEHIDYPEIEMEDDEYIELVNNMRDVEKDYGIDEMSNL